MGESMKGRAAFDEYMRRFPAADVSDLSEEDRDSFEFDTEPVPIKTVRLDRLLVHAGLAPSVSAAARLIEAGAVKIRGEKTFDRIEMLRTDEPVAIRVGKREKMVKIAG